MRFGGGFGREGESGRAGSETKCGGGGGRGRGGGAGAGAGAGSDVNEERCSGAGTGLSRYLAAVPEGPAAAASSPSELLVLQGKRKQVSAAARLSHLLHVPAKNSRRFLSSWRQTKRSPGTRASCLILGFQRLAHGRFLFPASLARRLLTFPTSGDLFDWALFVDFGLGRTGASGGRRRGRHGGKALWGEGVRARAIDLAASGPRFRRSQADPCRVEHLAQASWPV